MNQDVLQRLRGEYVETPGLRLTTSQVQRLCGIDDTSCAAALAMLVNAGFLHLKPDGTYVRVTPEASENRRSADRLPLPPCETCRTNALVSAVSRTDYVVYFRCSKCSALIVQPKHRRQLGT